MCMNNPVTLLYACMYVRAEWPWPMRCGVIDPSLSTSYVGLIFCSRVWVLLVRQISTCIYSMSMDTD